MRDVLTTLIDLLAVLLLATGVGVALAAWSPAAGFIGAGGLLLGSSWLASRPGKGER